MKNAITNYENVFYYERSALSGVLSVDGSYSLEYSPINVVGKGFLKQVMSTVPSASLSVSRFLTRQDPVLDATGMSNRLAKSVNAGLYYKNKYFAFQHGYLSSFGLSCSVGEMPIISNDFEVYGDIGGNFDPSGDAYAGVVFVPQVKNIILTTKGSATNRITQFNVDYSIPKSAIYGISEFNSEIPIEVHNMYPIEITSSFTIEIDDYQTKSIFNDLTSNSASEFSIDIKASVLNDIGLETAEGIQFETSDNEGINSQNKGDDPSIFSFSASDAVIVSEQVSSTSDDVMSVNLSYKTYLN
tara:strand:+ start:3851 stop:4750 length:900 start_codon:yes stop_codon:yes gene_type:complete